MSEIKDKFLEWNTEEKNNTSVARRTYDLIKFNNSIQNFYLKYQYLLNLRGKKTASAKKTKMFPVDIDLKYLRG